jgi:hypothetical protein
VWLLAIFLGPIVLAGIVFLVLGVVFWDDPRVGQAWIAVVLGVIAICVGGLPLLWQLAGKGWILQELRMQRKHPGRPWLWRDDWAKGVIAGEAAGILLRRWLKVAVVTAACWAFLYLSSSSVVGLDFLYQHYPVLSSVLLVVFVVWPIWALCHATYVSLRYSKFGVSSFLMSVIPCQVGGRLKGKVETLLQEPPEDGFLVRLCSIRRMRAHRRIHERTAWSAEQTVGAERVGRGVSGLTVPVDIEIPADADPSGRVNSDEWVYWRLTVAASVPGIDYEATFQPPVFRLNAEGYVP